MMSQRDVLAELCGHLGITPPSESQLDTVYRPLVTWVKAQCLTNPAFVLGINGAQGSGKSTLCHMLKTLLAHEGLSVAVLSIDDLYLTRRERQSLAQDIHPLCAIRGVPGTHDVDLGLRLLNHLRALRHGDALELPRFDKARDDRRPETEFDAVVGPIDVVLFEGWCVGETPLLTYDGPFNEREARDDPEGIWSRWSLACLNDQYQSLNNALDALIMIKVPSMETVRQSRWRQEKMLRERLGNLSDTEVLPGLMTKAEVFEYVELFERHTMHMFSDLPAHCQLVIHRDASYNFRMSWR
ncbi:MAG: kinase [Bradymonadia bacterium]